MARPFSTVIYRVVGVIHEESSSRYTSFALALNHFRNAPIGHLKKLKVCLQRGSQSAMTPNIQRQLESELILKSNCA